MSNRYIFAFAFFFIQTSPRILQYHDRLNPLFGLLTDLQYLLSNSLSVLFILFGHL